MREDEIPSEKLGRGSRKDKTAMYNSTTTILHDKWRKSYLNPYNVHILNEYLHSKNHENRKKLW